MLAIQSGIKGLGAKMKNYGVPVLGPFPSTRLIINPKKFKSPSPHFCFDPLILFSGATTRPDAPFYITNRMEAADFMHALWILVKSPFARGMKFDLSLSGNHHPRQLSRTDHFVKIVVLPWLHTNINSIELYASIHDVGPSSARLRSMKDELAKHHKASKKEPNLHLYKAICDYLERLLWQGEVYVDQGNFCAGELSFERVCYEACSLVRTRTSALVDVSSRSKDGINRICKLIAVSAFRLCELRSGSLAQLILKKQQKQQVKNKENETGPKTSGVCGTAPTVSTACKGCQEVKLSTGVSAEHIDDVSSNVPEDTTSTSTADSASTPTGDSPLISSSGKRPPNVTETISKNLQHTSTVDSGKPQLALASPAKMPIVPTLPRTSRLEPPLARDLALTSGLLALRLPCASPVPEWNMRLDIMLLRLFATKTDASNAIWCMKRIHNNGNAVMNNLKQMHKTFDKKWEQFNEVMQDLSQQLKPGATKDCFFATADKVEQAVVLLWGERLIPKKGYTGLIWTFRWAG